MIVNSAQILYKRRSIWNSKRILQRLYHNWYSIIQNSLRPGLTLEVGGGSGNLKGHIPDIISSDVLYVKWLDVVLDAHHLPFKDESVDNIVLFDVLHHLGNLLSFFSDAERVLKQNGRILLMEPNVSLLSFLVYRFLHSEGMSCHIDPFQRDLGKVKTPFQGNQAIPTLIFGRDQHRFVENFPCLKIIKKERMDCLIYPLSGGFHNPSLCPLFLYNIIEYMEKLLMPLNRFLAFRLFVVLEKIHP